jgi:hypothetical protein
VLIKLVLATPIPRHAAANYKLPTVGASWQNVSDVSLRDLPYMHALVSMQWALSLLHRAIDAAPVDAMARRWWETPLSQPAPASARHRRAADAVLLLRWDALFFTPFMIGELNSSLLYRSNFCLAPGDGGDVAGEKCVPLVPYFNRKCPHGDVPDYWFAANGTVMELVFGRALQEYSQKKFNRKNCAVLHGVLAGLIAYKRATLHVPLGRYRYHHMDSEIFRQPLLDPRLRGFLGETRAGSTAPVGAEAELGRVWQHSSAMHALSNHPYEYDWREQRTCSVCSSGLRFCGCPSSYLAMAAINATPRIVPRARLCMPLPRLEYPATRCNDSRS